MEEIFNALCPLQFLILCRPFFSAEQYVSEKSGVLIIIISVVRLHCQERDVIQQKEKSKERKM